LAPHKANNDKNMRKLILLNVVLAIVITSAVATAYAQRETATGVSIEKDIDLIRRDMRAERKKIIAMNVTLTEQESTRLWPVYDQYEAEMAKGNDEFHAIVRDYVTNQKAMTDDQAVQFLKRWNDAQIKVMETRKKFYPMIEKAIPIKKAALLLQVDRRLRALQDVQISSEFPLITN
jgi:hypothetical protein